MNGRTFSQNHCKRGKSHRHRPAAIPIFASNFIFVAGLFSLLCGRRVKEGGLMDRLAEAVVLYVLIGLKLGV